MGSASKENTSDQTRQAVAQNVLDRMCVLTGQNNRVVKLVVDLMDVWVNEWLVQEPVTPEEYGVLYHHEEKDLGKINWETWDIF